ncbi:MAG: hypothetical protein ACREXS_00685 [Gammaproteobacteria bacterium]
MDPVVSEQVAQVNCRIQATKTQVVFGCCDFAFSDQAGIDVDTHGALAIQLRHNIDDEHITLSFARGWIATRSFDPAAARAARRGENVRKSASYGTKAALCGARWIAVKWEIPGAA